MAISLTLRTDPTCAVKVVGSQVVCALCPFPQPGPSTLIFTQLLDAVVRQEVTRVLPAASATRITEPWPGVWGFALLPPGVGVDSFRLRVMDGVTVVFDEGPFVY